MDKRIFEKAVQERAYHLWVEEGKPHGRDTYFWAQAEKQLRAEGVLVDEDIVDEQADLDAAEERRKAADE
jgi:hypothetical protein